MKTVKSLLLGSAAGFVAIAGAQAADLPLAEPVEYVRVCSTYGEGFFYIPGTDTCLQIGGKVRVELYGNNDDFSTGNAFADFTDEEGDDFATRARGVLTADARTETEWGTLRSYIEYEFNSDTGIDGDGSGDESGIEQIAAFVQFAGITAGKAPSFYDFVEYDSIGDFFSSEDVWTLAYTASFGSGFAATIGIEDKSYRELGAVSTDGTGDVVAGGIAEFDQVWPNVIAALRVDQAWGSAQISAAVQDNEGDRDEYISTGFAGDDIGWAVQAGLKLNLPFAMEGTYVWAQGAYSEGAISYAGAEDVTGNFVNVSLGLADQDIVAGEFINNEMWQVGGGVGVQASETVRLNLMGSYFEYDDSSADVLEAFSIEGNIFWTPVDNLDLGVAVLYSDAEQGADEVDTWGVVGRIERGF